MEITEAQYAQIEGCLPRQRGNVSLGNLQVLNAILYVTEQGCKWRGLPKRVSKLPVLAWAHSSGRSNSCSC